MPGARDGLAVALAAAFVIASDQHSAGFFGAVLLLPFSAQNAQFGVVPVRMSMTSRTDGFTHSVEAWLPSSRLSGVPADRRALIRARLIRDLGGSDRPADDQRGERVRNLAAGLQVGLNYCFSVNATSACPRYWLSVFQSIFASTLTLLCLCRTS